MILIFHSVKTLRSPSSLNPLQTTRSRRIWARRTCICWRGSCRWDWWMRIRITSNIWKATETCEEDDLLQTSSSSVTQKHSCSWRPPRICEGRTTSALCSGFKVTLTASPDLPPSRGKCTLLKHDSEFGISERCKVELKFYCFTAAVGATRGFIMWTWTSSLLRRQEVSPSCFSGTCFVCACFDVSNTEHIHDAVRCVWCCRCFQCWNQTTSLKRYQDFCCANK